MIVSCPSCSTGYKLDESRITGRGVRITCPKCKHVFVVYKEAPAQPMPKAQASASLVEAVEDERPADPDGPTSFFHTGAGGLRPADLTASTRPASPASPALPPARPPQPAPPPPAPPPAAVRPPLDVHALDFRKVGIPAWKVKGRIGLVFDFNDFKTLSRYIADGRVTPSDRLSHDGKTWTEIGALGDLEAHFVKVYQDAEDALATAAAAKLEASAATAEAFKDDEPTNIMGMSGMDDEVVKNLAAPGPSPLASFQASAPARILPGADLNALAAAAVEAEARAERPPREPEGPRFVDPFEKKRAEGKPKSGGSGPSKPSAGGPPATPKPQSGGGRAAPPPAPSRAPAAVGAVALLALLAAGAWWFTRPDEAAPGPAPAPAPAAAVDGTANRDRVNEKIREELQPAEGEAAPPSDDFGVEQEKELIPVGPRDGKGPRPASQGSGGAGGGSTARDHAAVGDDAMGRRDWSAAVAAYRKAVSADPRNAVYNGKLGEALLRGGDNGGAMQPLMTGAQGGYAPAWRGLGDAAEAQGDRSGAIGYYQRYLSSRPTPRDAPQVQQRIDKLSGS